MEGLRGVAVLLVFLQHYCRQGLQFPINHTEAFAETFRNFGNRGVELFFVLSGFLIYGILLKRRPTFWAFMLRRAQRIYPAFLAVFALAVAMDFMGFTSKIPWAPVEAAEYLAENLAFLPGLLPIEPLFTVNWTLSYEWWFYTSMAAMFSAFDFGSLPQVYRVAVVLNVGVALVVLSAFKVPNVPIRGLCFFAGILLAEYRMAALPALGWKSAVAAFALAFAICVRPELPEWVLVLSLSVAYFAVCSAAFGPANPLGKALSWKYLRWLGNISYSFYLLHALAVVVIARVVMARLANHTSPDTAFALLLVPAFLAAFAASAVIFLAVEKPFSLTSHTKGRRHPAGANASKV